MQEFFITKGSVLPVLEMELIKDGRYDFERSMINEALQDSVVTFSMADEETGILKIANAPADIVMSADGDCEEEYFLRYKWDKRDTAKEGFYKGWFEITFNGNITSDGIVYPEGNIIVPIEEDLRIIVK
jgi:hypothetical protein